jgi:hypothetical protein
LRNTIVGLQLPPISYWDEMKPKLQEKYLPIEYEDSVFADLRALKQESMTVNEYTHRFHELTIRSRLTETERQSLTRYKAGLREDICKELIIVRLASIEKTYQLQKVALQLEQFKWTGTRCTSFGWSGGSSWNIHPTTIKGPSPGGD